MTETQMRANGPAGKFTPFINLLDETLRRKNAAYGDSASQAPMFAPNVSPEESVWVRLGDKVARLASLLRGGPDNGESIDDTLLDLAGYAAILWTLRRTGGREAQGDSDGGHLRPNGPNDYPRPEEGIMAPAPRWPKYEVTCRH